MRAAVVRCLYPVNRGGQGLKEALDNVRAKVSAAIRDGARIIVLSDRESNEQMAPIPSLLAVSAVHHHLVRDRTRTQVASQPVYLEMPAQTPISMPFGRSR